MGLLKCWIDDWALASEIATKSILLCAGVHVRNILVQTSFVLGYPVAIPRLTPIKGPQCSNGQRKPHVPWHRSEKIFIQPKLVETPEEPIQWVLPNTMLRFARILDPIGDRIQRGAEIIPHGWARLLPKNQSTKKRSANTCTALAARWNDARRIKLDRARIATTIWLAEWKIWCKDITTSCRPLQNKNAI